MNSMYFTPKMINDGELIALLTVLMNMSYSPENPFYNSINIEPAGDGGFVCNWGQKLRPQAKESIETETKSESAAVAAEATESAVKKEIEE